MLRKSAFILFVLLITMPAYATAGNSDGRFLNNLLNSVMLVFSSGEDKHDGTGDRHKEGKADETDGSEGDVTPALSPAPTGAGGRTGIQIITHSSGRHTLSGAYASSCYGTGGASQQDIDTVTGKVLVKTVNQYTALNCAGTPTVSTLTASIAAGPMAKITQWINGMGAVIAAPMGADGVTPLTNTESITPMTVTVINTTGTFFAGVSVGANQTIFYVADDTDTATPRIVLYRGDSNNGVVVSASTADPLIQVR